MRVLAFCFLMRLMGLLEGVEEVLEWRGEVRNPGSYAERDGMVTGLISVLYEAKGSSDNLDIDVTIIAS